MKAFWWFKDDKIAGMARPGFNRAHWFDLPFDEAILLGWIGKFTSGRHDLSQLKAHIAGYAPRIYRFYGLDEKSGPKVLEILNSDEGINEVMSRLSARIGAYRDFKIDSNQIEFSICDARLADEISFLKERKIDRVITLTEHHNERDRLEEHFELHHISIEDLGAPQIEQVHQLVDILADADASRQKVSVHCLAGIGRTSTMLAAAHLLMGESLAELQNELKKRNPTFEFAGPQGEFLKSLAKN